ncbi:MAG: hypothetical protein KAY08_00285 [Giesbergeria sp.]|nr:hypothetical protein [Giesbergeria sp.]
MHAPEGIWSTIFMAAAGHAARGGQTAALPENAPARKAMHCSARAVQGKARQGKTRQCQRLQIARKTKNTLKQLEVSDFFTSHFSLVLLLLKDFWDACKCIGHK